MGRERLQVGIPRETKFQRRVHVYSIHYIVADPTPSIIIRNFWKETKKECSNLISIRTIKRFCELLVSFCFVEGIGYVFELLCPKRPKLHL